jgi:3-dehydroquinate synthase
MNKIKVNLKNNPYTIFIENRLCNNIDNVLNPFNNGQKWIIFSQKFIFEQYGQDIQNKLINCGFEVEKIILVDGESAKSLSSLESIYSKLMDFGCSRDSTFIALGGGVIGDLTGFIAATFMRGVQYVQIPTTLLAMVDSSIGGKTGINIPQGKNLVGSIYQPLAVIVDPKLLYSLPDREIISGMAEVIKYGLILDRQLFQLLNKNIYNIINLSSEQVVEEVIVRCAQLKTKIIIEDEFENDRRRILNFGHTIGHALEAYFNFDGLRHGEAVAYGMIAAAKLSVLFSNLKEKNYNLLVGLIKNLSLPEIGNIEADNILKILKNDKKVKLGEVHFILLNDIGNTVIRNDIHDDAIVKVIESL